MAAKRALILIVDDTPEDIAIYKRHLTRDQSRRYKILKASKGAKALAICERRRPDCVLLNFRLPDLNGLEVLRALADKSGILPFAVVMLAEAGDTHVAVDAMKYGAHDFLEKSWITPEMLERAIANAIEKSALQREVEEQRRELAIKNVMLEQRLVDLQREVNERRQVEEALTAIERRFKRLIEAQPSIVWMSDAMGAVTYINDYWTELTGLTFEQSLGAGWLAAVHPDDAQRIEVEWNQAVVASASHESRHRYLRPNGEYRWHLCRSVPLRDESGAIQEWVGVSVDIHDRLRAEEALRLANDRFTVAEAAANGYVYDRDPVTNRVERSAGFGAVLGYDESETAGTHEWWRTLIHPDDIHRVKAMLDQASIGQGMDETDGYSLEYRIRHKDGRYLWVWDRGRPMRDETGRVRRVIGSVVDISGRKQIENTLRENESRLKLAITAMNGGAWEWDLITDEVRLSDEMYELFDRRPSDFNPTVEGWLWTLSAGDRARAAEVIEAVRRGEDAQMVYCATGPDGADRWFELRGITLHDDGGRPVLLVGITIDITERKLAEEALRESEARAHTLAANLSDGLIYQMRRGSDGSRRFLYISENVERLRGVTAEEAMADANKLYNLVPEDYRARLIEAEDAALRDGADFRFETPFLTSTGELRWSQQSSSPRRLSDGSVVWDGVEIDITERKRAEATLRESEEKFSKVFKSSPHRIAITTLDEGRYIDVNDAVLRTTGYERSEMIGRTGKELEMFAWPGGREGFFQALQNGPVRDLEVPLRSKSGEIRTVLMSADIITLNGQKCILAVSNDITERKRTEEALRESEEKFSKVFKASPVRITISTLDEGRYIDVNDAVLSGTGYERSEMVGRTANEINIFAGDGRKRLAQALKNGSVRDLEVRLRSKNGEVRTVLMSAEIITLNGRQCVVTLTNDITERMRTEAARRESEERLKLAMDAAGMFVWETDLATGRVTWSDSGEQMMGMEPGSFGGTYDAFLALVHPDDRESVISARNRALDGEAPYEVEYRKMRPDGGLQWALSRGIVYRDEAGRPARLVGVSMDITERKQAEEELREKERFIQSLIDAVPVGIYIYDLKEKRNLFTNPRLATLLGYTPDDLTAMGADFLGLLLHPEDWRRAIAHLETLREAPNGAVLEIEYRMKHRDGQWRWVVSREMVFRRGADGRPSQILGVWQEITERKLAEEELHRANRRYQITLDALDGYIYEYNIGDNASERSKGLAKLIGFEPEEAPPRLEWWVDRIHPDDRDRFRSEVGKALAEESALRGETPYSMEYRMLHKERHYVDVLDRFLVVRDADGRPIQVVGAVINITERKRVEETLRENEERLRMAMDAANAGSFDWDIASGVIVWAPGRRRSTQTQNIEQDYQSWRASVHPEDIDWVEADIAKRLAEQRDLYIEYRVLRPDGSVRWVSNIGHAFYNEAGEPTRMKGLMIDLTDRKRAEELLREGEERLRLALEGAKAGVWEVKFDPYSAYWSKEYRDLFGFSETDEATNELWATRVHPDDLQRVVDGNNALLSAHRNEMRQEFRIIHPEHGERWILDFVRVRRDQAGRPISFGGINLDVTDRRRAEEALRESEERFRELVETISDVFWIMSPESQAPTYLSPACERLWGRPAKELNGDLDRWFDAIHHEDRERVRKKYLARAGEGGYDETYRVVRPDGTMVWVHDRGFPVCDEAGNIRHIVGVAEDVTERKRFEDELSESQRRYAALAEAVPQLVWTAAADGGVDYFNQRWYAYTETTPDESLDQAWRSLIHPDDRERVERLWKRSVRVGDHLHFEFRLRGADGGYRWFIGRAVPYREERRGATLRKQDGANGAALNGGKGRIVKWFGTFTDIHDLKIAEEALRESEEQARRQNAELENIYQATPVGLSLLDREFRFVRVNETMARIDGASVSGALGRTAREVTPKIADRLEPVFKRVIKTGRPIMNLEIRVETPREPGVERDWLASYYPVKAADGSVQGVGCVVLDITERKRAEEAVRESEERLRQAAQAAGFGLYSVNLQTGENYWSPELRRIFGLSDDDAVMLDGSLGLIHPDDRERTMRVIEAALDPRGDGEFEHEFRAQLADGNTRWALAKGKTLFNGNGRRRKASRIIGVAFDITERMEDEERLHASERRLKLSLTAGRAGTWEWRIKEDKLIWSDEYYELYGMAPGDLEPTMDNFILCVHPEDRSRILAEMSEVLQERKDAELEFRFIRAGGEERWAHSNAQLTLDESGEPEMMVGIIIDITERKQAEMEREALLRNEREAREQAEAANRGKDEFVAMVSHELRSPLNAMLGWSKILKKGGVDAKTQSHAVEVIERSARTQQTLIEDLLDMARIVGGKLRLDTRPVSLARVVEAAFDVVRPAAELREIDLRRHINSTDEVTGDPDRLQQVVWNLLSNAVKFTTRGGCVEVALERVGASAQITVTDTGRGIKAEDLPFIFDRFRQADSSGSRRFAGLGLGLALVKHLVELHGGQVSADSLGEGKGASFIVRFPVRAVRGEATPARGMDRASLRIEERDGRVTEREARGDFPAFPLDGVWALIVDDEADARELIATLLKQYGARVTIASCAAEAFDKLRKGEAGARPDVLISDISMPDEDGYMLIERVRNLPSEEGGKIPAIALTALERPNDRIKSLASGFSMHVPKPVEPEELVMVIANLTGHPAGIIL